MASSPLETATGSSTLATSKMPTSTLRRALSEDSGKKRWEGLQRGILKGLESEARATKGLSATTSLEDTLSMSSTSSSGLGSGDEGDSRAPLSSFLSGIGGEKSPQPDKPITTSESADSALNLAGVLSEVADIDRGKVPPPPSGKRISVSFSEEHVSHPVPLLADLSDEEIAMAWHMESDSLRFQEDIIRMLIAEKKGTLEKEGRESRGIEHLLIPSHAKKRREKMTASIQAILQEQDRQRASSSGRLDEKWLRRTYEAHTKWAKDIALEVGASDAAYVRRHVQRDHKASRSSSVTKNVLSRLKTHPQSTAAPNVLSGPETKSSAVPLEEHCLSLLEGALDLSSAE